MKSAPKEEDKRLNKRLQKFRKEQHITQDEMAEFCNVSKSYISTMERGIYRCNPHVLMCYARKLSVSLDTLCKQEYKETTSKNDILPELQAEIAKMNLQTQKKLLKMIHILNE